MSENYTSREERRKKSTEGKGKQKPSGSGKPNKKKRGGIFRKIIVAILLLGIIGVIAGAATFFAMISDAPKIDDAMLKDPLSSKIYDKNGNKIAELGINRRTYANYDEIPESVKNAFLATEDARFYKHHGVDFYRLGGAVLANFKDGFGSEGASTITQQVVKNSVLSPEKTVKRKVQEMWLSFKLEQKYSKNKILEMYLNKIYFASGSAPVYGIKEAADHFYGVKDLKDLKIEQAAMLAGLPKAPTTYNPYVNPDRAKNRRDTVLMLMAKHGFISKEDSKKAQQVPITEGLVKQDKTEDKYTVFVDQVIKEIKEKTGADIFSAGLEIHTTLDPDAQDYMDRAMNTDEIVQYPNKDFQVGMVLLDTKTGEVQAIGGGRNRVARGLNFATDFPRQPGSTIKPILDYGPAVDKLKWSTAEPINDEEGYSYTNGTPIKNFEGGYKGWMTIRQALADSRNIPALKAFQAAGADKAREFATGLGIPLEKSIPESYSIGGFEHGITPMQLAGAYSAFGNEGIYNKPHTVTKVVFPDGTEMDLSPKPKVAMKDYTSFILTEMMRSVVEDGTGKKAAIAGLPVAGKTGTTNFPKEVRDRYDIPSNGVPDIWFAGYTPKYTAAVWTGYEKTNSKNYILSPTEKNFAKEIFKKVVGHVSEGKKTGEFKQPDSVEKVAIEKDSFPTRKPSAYTPKDKIGYEYFVKGTEPTKVSKKFKATSAKKPQGLSANYDSVTNHIYLNWSYPDEDMSKTSFEVSVSVDGSGAQQLTTTNQLNVALPNPNPGSRYKFKVVAVNDGVRSAPSYASVSIPGGEEEQPAEDPGQTDENQDPGTDPNAPDPNEDQGSEDNGQTNPGDNNGNNGQDNGQKPGDNNGNGNGNGNGSGNNNGNNGGNNSGNNGGNTGGDNGGNGDTGGGNNQQPTQPTNPGTTPPGQSQPGQPTTPGTTPPGQGQPSNPGKNPGNGDSTDQPESSPTP